MTGIGLINEERLGLLPKSVWSQHEYSFHLHDLMVALLLEMENKRAGHVKFTLESEEEKRLLESGEHVLDFLGKTGRSDIERRAVINHVSVALYADLLHFIFEALSALEKRKFTVAITLLRKPFKEGLIVLAAMCADEANFFHQLKSNPRDAFDASLHSKEIVIEIISKAFEKADISFVDPGFVHQFIFDRKYDFGLSQLFDKATHLFTKNRHIATENYNINFIFKNPLDDDIYQLYGGIALVLHVLRMFQIELFSRTSLGIPDHVKISKFTTTGAFEAIFTRNRTMVSLANSTLKEVLVCPSCKQQIKINRASAPRFFLLEVLHCRGCRTEHHFPVSWLLQHFGEWDD